MSDAPQRNGHAAIDQPLYACLYRPPLPGEARASTSGLRPPPDLRPPASDRAGLVAIAAGFSPRYELHRADLVSIDVRGLSRLLGTPRTIGAELRREAAARGIRVHVAVAPARIAAAVLAIARPGLTVVNAASLAEALATVPLAVLEQLPDDPPPAGASAAQSRLRADETRTAMASMKRWGLRTLGELAVLPAADLSARLGRGGRLWQAIARGEDLRPLVPMEPEERFDGTMPLEWPIEGTEPLSFVLTRLLEPLSTRLERRDRGAAVLHVQLGLVTRELHSVRLELPSPLREVRAMRTLVLLDIESHPPPAAIDIVTVIIEPTPGRILQHALFTRPHPTPEQLSTLLARLGALVGQDRIGAPALVDTHRPGACAMTPFAIEQGTSIKSAVGRRQSPAGQSAVGQSSVDCPHASVDAVSPQPPIAALRRCRRPVPARVTLDDAQRPVRVASDRRGFAGGAVLASAGPWRTSGGWWEEEPEESGKLKVEREKLIANSEELIANSEKPTMGRRTFELKQRGAWSRDEWDVAVADGVVYRIYRDRVTDGWFIDGVVD